MAHCPSCGGRLGVDCFNPIECAEITNSMNQFDTYELERQIEVLKNELTKHNIPIPDLNPIEIEVVYTTDNGLPF